MLKNRHSLKSNLIGDKAFYKAVFAIIIPFIVQNTISSFVNLLDNVMVGQLGTPQINGVAIANQLFFIFNICIFGSISGASIFGAQFFGAKDFENMRASARFKLYACISVFAMGAVIFLTLDDQLISLFLNDADKPAEVALTLAEGKKYLFIMLLGLLPFAVTQAYASTLREAGETVLPMVAGIEAVFVTVIGNYILIFGHFGAPQMGVEGAAVARENLNNDDTENNACLKYAALRNVLYNKGKSMEILVAYEPAVQMFCEWWKQLYGESEGKDQKGIFPASVDLTTDLHSMGQFIQDGTRILFETVIDIEKSREEIIIGTEPVDLDGLNYLAGKTVDFVNKSAMNGTILAHTDGQVPNFMIHIPEVSEFYLGELFYFFEFACGVSGYMLGVNPFNQPGVESYKKNMFALLGKPGFEAQREELLKRL